MSKASEAADFFKGNNGKKRVNCAVSVAMALKDLYNIPDGYIEKMQLSGSGKAPDGLCGAVYAAQIILENNIPQKLEEFNNYFISKAGSLKCREIRKNRTPACAECVFIAADFF